MRRGRRRIELNFDVLCAEIQISGRQDVPQGPTAKQRRRDPDWKTVSTYGSNSSGQGNVPTGGGVNRFRTGSMSQFLCDLLRLDYCTAAGCPIQPNWTFILKVSKQEAQQPGLKVRLWESVNVCAFPPRAFGCAPKGKQAVHDVAFASPFVGRCRERRAQTPCVQNMPFPSWSSLHFPNPTIGRCSASKERN